MSEDERPCRSHHGGKIDVLLILGKGVVMDLLELSPVVDGDFIPDEPSQLFHNAAQLITCRDHSMDGHFFAGVDVPSINMKNATTVAQVKGLLAGLTKEKGNAAIDSAYSTYTSHWGSVPDQAVIALQLHANNTSGARTYSYLFNMKTRIPGFPRWVEAEHAEDLQYLFGPVIPVMVTVKFQLRGRLHQISPPVHDHQQQDQQVLHQLRPEIVLR
ncbi:Bile salt-activated lipase [Larimichthys crocea]|uniref:Bile salt-activated lipase n=1 Tax=Larimichthys crocea TaxID=215358 RepID=A0A6G0HD57_LARCR|nr:Bile salt-activated lipase [Larimichthys crocea]